MLFSLDFLCLWAMMPIRRLLQVIPSPSSPLACFHQVFLLFHKKCLINLFLLWSSKPSNKRPPSFKRFSQISASPKIRNSLRTTTCFKHPFLNTPSLREGFFIRKMVTYLFKSILSVGSRNQLDIIIYRSYCCYFLWKIFWRFWIIKWSF